MYFTLKDKKLSLPLALIFIEKQKQGKLIMHLIALNKFTKLTTATI